MPSRLQILVDLLHAAGEAALATQSQSLPGHPFASAVSFATDERHRPLLLISKLAEHTRNLAADRRASLMLAKALGDGEMARVSLVGELRPVEAEPPLVRRYLRYHPEAERFLQLGDFGFHRFEPARILVVGGFAQAGWLDGRQLLDVPYLPLGDEDALLAAARAGVPADCALLGVDAFGVDVREAGVRRRIAFADAPVAAAALPTILVQTFSR